MEMFFWGFIAGGLIGLLVAGLCAVAGKSALMEENEELRRGNIRLWIEQYNKQCGRC